MGDNVNATNVLDLISSGTISQTSGTIGAGTLTGSAQSATLNLANAVASVGSFSATSGSFVLNDSGLAGSLTVSGPLRSLTNDVSITGAPTLSLTGSITANGTALLNIGAGGVSLAANSGLSGNIVDVTSAGTVGENAAATITAGSLQSSGNVTGNVSLLGTSNAVTNLGNFAVTTGNFALQDSALTVTGNVSVNGATQLWLQAPSISIGAAGTLKATSGVVALLTNSLANSGSINGKSFALAPSASNATLTVGAAGTGLSLVSLSGITTNDLLLGASMSAGNPSTFSTQAGTVDIAGAFNAPANLGLYATNSITQSAKLTGNSAITVQGGATVQLTNPGNAFAKFTTVPTTGAIQLFDSSAFTATNVTSSGNVYLGSSNAGGVTLAGTVTSNSGTIGIQADALTISSGKFSSNTFELAPFTAGTTMTLGATGGLSLASLTAVTASTVRLGAIHVPGTVAPATTAGTIVVGGNFGSSGAALELDSLGGITEFGRFRTDREHVVGQCERRGQLAQQQRAHRAGQLHRHWRRQQLCAAGQWSIVDRWHGQCTRPGLSRRRQRGRHQHRRRGQRFSRDAGQLPERCPRQRRLGGRYHV